MCSPANFTTTPIGVNRRHVPLEPAPCGSEIGDVRAIVVSRVYADPAARGKLKALAGLGVTVAAAVPDRWMPAGLVARAADRLGRRRRRAHRAHSHPRQLRSDRRSRVARRRRCGGCFRTSAPTSCRSRRSRGRAAPPRSRAPRGGSGPPYVVLARAEPADRQRSMLPKLRRNRTLSGAVGIVGGQRVGHAARRARSSRPASSHRAPGRRPAPAQHATAPTHVGLSIGFVGRLIPEKGLDLLFRACVKLVGRWNITVVGTGRPRRSWRGWPGGSASPAG